jgi:preprotein translocase subunit SecB
MPRNGTKPRQSVLPVQVTAPLLHAVTLAVVDPGDEPDQSEGQGVSLDFNATRSARNEVRLSVKTRVTGQPTLRLSATLEIGVRVVDDGEAPLEDIDAALHATLERDSVPYVYPYVRELVSDLTTRAFGRALMLPVVRLSEMKMTVIVPPFEVSIGEPAEASSKAEARPSRSRKKASRATE